MICGALIRKGPSSGSRNFGYLGSVQSFTVPSGFTSLSVVLSGGGGGSGTYDGSEEVGGAADRVVTTISVTPGETLQVYVGGGGTSNWEDGSVAGGWPDGYSGNFDGYGGYGGGTGGSSYLMRSGVKIASARGGSGGMSAEPMSGVNIGTTVFAYGGSIVEQPGYINIAWGV